jgi:hypothetical protein
LQYFSVLNLAENTAKSAMILKRVARNEPGGGEIRPHALTVIVQVYYCMSSKPFNIKKIGEDLGLESSAVLKLIPNADHFQCNLCPIIRKKGNGNTNLLSHLVTIAFLSDDWTQITLEMISVMSRACISWSYLAPDPRQYF